MTMMSSWVKSPDSPLREGRTARRTSPTFTSASRRHADLGAGAVLRRGRRGRFTESEPTAGVRRQRQREETARLFRVDGHGAAVDLLGGGHGTEGEIPRLPRDVESPVLVPGDAGGPRAGLAGRAGHEDLGAPPRLTPGSTNAEVDALEAASIVLPDDGDPAVLGPGDRGD